MLKRKSVKEIYSRRINTSSALMNIPQDSDFDEPPPTKKYSRVAINSDEGIVLVNVKKFNLEDDVLHRNSFLGNESAVSVKSDKSDEGKLCAFCHKQVHSQSMLECVNELMCNNDCRVTQSNRRATSTATVTASLLNVSKGQIRESTQEAIKMAVYQIVGGKLAMIKKNIKSGKYSVNETCNHGIPLIFYAIKYDKPDIVAYLLHKKANIFLTTTTNRNLIHFAHLQELVTKKEKNRIFSVFKKTKKNSPPHTLISLLKERDSDGNTALHIACRYMSSDVLAKLLTLYFSVLTDPNDILDIIKTRNNQMETCLHAAANAKSAEVIFFLIDNLRDMFFSCAVTKSPSIYWEYHVTMIQMLKWNNAEGENVLFTLCRSYCDCGGGEEDRMKCDVCDVCDIATATFVRIFLKYCPEIFTSLDRFERHPLCAATVYGNLALVKQLIETVNLDPEQRDINLRTSIHHAAARGFISIVNYLVNTYKVNISARDDKGVTAIHYATIKQHLEIIEILITANRNVDMKNESGHTSLMWAVVNGCSKSLAKIVQLNPTHCKNEFDYDGLNAVHLAIKSGQKEALVYLLQNGWSTSIKTLHGETCGQVAIKGNQSHILTVLLDRYINYNETDNTGNTIMHLAASNRKYLHILDYLLKQSDTCWNSINVKNDEGNTPIAVAATKQCIGNFKLLATSDADLDVANNDGMTPVMIAIKNNLWPLIVATNYIKFEINSYNDQEKKTILDYVMDSKNFPIAMQLRQAGALTAQEYLAQ
uniref:ANK_REP_REGION domain-containing protein n=1 Tax=Rhabditophanes sp. KR3021 TaxID=114890 RepID=A0AC35TGR3_9BILA